MKNSAKNTASFFCLTVLLLYVSFLQPVTAQSERPSGVTETDTVYVAPPTGEREIDRASILAALEEVEPSGIVQFAPGKYVVGKVIQISNPQITLLGHPDGTILRGCEPEEFTEIEKALETVTNPTEGWAVVSGCGMLELTGGNVTVRNFTFEYTRLGLLLGSSHAEDILYSSEGGYLIEENTFRNSSNSIRAMLVSPEPTIIRNNRFVNVFHAFSGAVSNFHILDNHISAPEPKNILPAGHPGFAIGLSALVSHDTVTSSCKQNLISGNQIVGHPDGIILSARQTDAGCQNNVIRSNSIEVQRAKLPASWPYFEHYPISDNDSTLVGIPLSLVKNENPLTQENTFKNNLIEDNQIAGAEGLGIEILNASQNRILNNTITGIINRQPFPGNTLGGTQFGSTANGSAIWISPGSKGNEITGNSFEDIASYAVFVEGDSNRVELRDFEDKVRDLGSDNTVTTKNDHVEPLYESKFVETRGIRLQYMDFGGDGLTIIFLQDFHDYFSIEEEEAHHAAWLSRFSDEYRVLAPVRRGWGESDDTGFGYDVATQSEDLLGLMDALEINRAVLVGRIPANQDMTWIAEHHPERVAGLIYVGNPRVFAFPNHPEVIAFNENYERGICDADVLEAEKWEKRTGARQAWRPHFFTDPEARIDIPTLRFYDPVWEGRSLNLQRLETERIKQLALSDHCGDEQAQRYFSELAEDEKRLENLRQVFRETDPSRKLNEAMENAFGSFMKTVVEEELMSLDDIYNFHFPHIRSFLKEIEQLEGKEE